MHDQIGHVANKVGSQAEVEENIEKIKDHLRWILGMQIAITNCC